MATNKIGNVLNLLTTVKTTVVAAINELYKRLIGYTPTQNIDISAVSDTIDVSAYPDVNNFNLTNGTKTITVLTGGATENALYRFSVASGQTVTFEHSATVKLDGQLTLILTGADGDYVVFLKVGSVYYQFSASQFGAISSSSLIPAGGTTAQLLAKASDTDYDLEWVDAPSGGGGTVATVNELNTGSNNTKFASPLGLEGSKYLTQNGTKLFALTSGTNSYTATLTPDIAAYVLGLRVEIGFMNANTGNVTLNLNGLGATSVVKNGNVPLVNSDIAAGQVLTLLYDGAQWQVVGGISGLYTVGTLDGASPTTSANGAVAVGTILYMQSAAATLAGVINTAAQSFSGIKTFLYGIVLGASTTLRAALTFTNGVDPTSPTDGQAWYRDSRLFMRKGTITTEVVTVDINESFSGVGNRMAQVDQYGNLVAADPIYNVEITDSTVITNLTTGGNWSGSVYSGPALALEQGQFYADSTYLYFMITTSVPKRMAFV